jgi:hypothetical protein
VCAHAWMCACVCVCVYIYINWLLYVVGVIEDWDN